MKKMMKKTNVVLLTCLMAIIAFCGVCFAKSTPQAVLAENTTTGTSVTGVQLRADTNGGLYYLVLLAREYSIGETLVSNPADYADLLTHITLYSSDSDETGVSAADICNTSDWIINRWGSGGLMIPMTADNYEANNGANTYKIKVTEGAVMPLSAGNDLVVRTTRSFVNGNYGVQDSKYGSFNWTTTDPDFINTEVTAFGDPDTASMQRDALWFTLSVNDYTVGNQEISIAQLQAMNLGEKVKFTIDGEEHALEEYSYNMAFVYRFGRAGKPFALYTSLSDYTVIDSVTIEAGCEFPSQATAGAPEAITKFITTEDVTFVNNGDGVFVEQAEVLPPMETSLKGVQLRADSAASLYYLVLIASEYSMTETVVANVSNYANLLSNITFYTSPEDTTGVSATDICKTSDWIINRWGSGGLMIAMTSENYETYNGSSVYKIKVNEGALMPYVAGQDLSASENSFINLNYGNNDAKYGSFAWAATNSEYVDTSVISFGDPDTASRQKDALWFTLSANNYTSVNFSISTAIFYTVNMGEKIKFTINGEESTLSDYSIREAYAWRFGREGKPLALYTSLTDYTTIETITIEEGCEFPAQSEVSIAAGLVVYRTTETVTLYNDGTGAFVGFDTIQTNAKNELAGYKNPEDYRDNEKAQITAILEEANTAIDGCDSLEGLLDVVSSAKERLDALKTDAEYTEEENNSGNEGSDSSNEGSDSSNEGSDSGTIVNPPASSSQETSGCFASVSGLSTVIAMLLCCGGAILLKRKGRAE